MKKYVLVVILITISTFSFSQTTNKANIETLKKEVVRLEKEIQIKLDTVNSLKDSISQIEYIETISRIKEKNNRFPVNAEVRRGGDIRATASFSEHSIGAVKKGSAIQLLEYKKGYWKIISGQVIGYLSDMYVKETDEILVLKEEMIKLEKIEDERIRIAKVEEFNTKVTKNLKEIEIEREKRLALEKKKEEDRKQKIRNQYGDKILQKLLDGYYWIGMTDEMTRVSLGSPDDINRTVGSWGTHEQWVYDSLYLYFEDGILTSWQD